MRVTASLLLTTLAGACSPAASDPEQPATIDRTYAGPASLVGEWRVASVDNSQVNLGWAITASIDKTTIRVASQCLTPSWTYDYTGGTLETRAVPDPVCERGRAPAEEAVLAVLDAGGTVERTPENGVLIMGGGHSITLFSQ